MVTSNLPRQPTPFIGRVEEINEITALLNDPTCRLLTLVGPGGIGKTRLAIEVATRVTGRFPDGVWFVSLAPIHDPALVADTIAQTLGVTEQANRPITEMLKAHLAEKSLLLVLDNFEQIVDAAPLLPELIAAAPKLTILVTSREMLNVRAERIFDAPPLNLPDPGVELAAFSANEAITLFVQRAMDVQPNFALTDANAPVIAEICARLDGLPLAIELAAARTRLFAPGALLDRLDDSLRVLRGGPRDAPARQQTLRDTIAWSYDLLTESECALFARLGVFGGGWTIEAAEAVGVIQELPYHDIDVLDGLDSLLNKSLIRRGEGGEGEPRFWMLETIRKFALERLAASGEGKVIRRHHAAYFERLVSQRPNMDLYHWLNLIRLDYDNVRTILAYWLDGGEIEQFILTVWDHLFWYWDGVGLTTEACDWIQRALESANNLSIPLRAKALIRLGWFQLRHTNYTVAAAISEEALELSRTTGEAELLAHALFQNAVPISGSGDYARAFTIFEEALTYAGDSAMRGLILNGMGEASRAQGDYTSARDYYERSAELMEAYSPARLGLAFTGLWLGDMELGRVRALHYLGLVNKLRVAERSQWKMEIALAFMLLVGVCGLTHQFADAARLFGVIDQFLEAEMYSLEFADQREYDHYLALTRDALDPDTFDALYDEGHAMSLEDAVAYALETSEPESAVALVEPFKTDLEIAQPKIPQPLVDPLSQRELEVLELIADGLTNRQIADQLYIGVSTVKKHINHIYSKLDVTHRAQAVARARTLSILS